MLINMNTAIYSKGVLITDKATILKIYFKKSFYLGKNYYLTYKINLFNIRHPSASSINHKIRNLIGF